MPEYKEYMYYCPKCGDAQFLEDKDGEQCEICGHKMLETPHEYQLTVKKYFEINLPELERAEKVRRNTEWEKKRQRLHEELISKSEIFDFDGSGIQRYFDTIILHFRQIHGLGGISQ